jgi:endonuclease G
MNSTLLKRDFGITFNSLAKKGVAIAFAAATLASLSTGAQAGLLGMFAGKVAEHVAEHQVEHQIEGHFKSPALIPGRDGPLAPSSNQGFAACPQLFPKSAPIDVGSVNAQWRAVGLCSNHFAVLNSALSKTPLVVVEKLNRAMLSDAKSEERTNEFYPDPRLARGSRAELVDFKSSGLDRGHLASAANQPDQQSMIQSFALSNMVPQDPFNNRKTWAKIESDVRKFARRAQGEVFVFSGPIFRGQQRTIGPDRVWVPSHLFKLVYDEASRRSWAYILANTAEARIEAPVDYAEFVKQTGWQLLGRSPG